MQHSTQFGEMSIFGQGTETQYRSVIEELLNERPSSPRGVIPASVRPWLIDHIGVRLSTRNDKLFDGIGVFGVSPSLEAHGELSSALAPLLVKQQVTPPTPTFAGEVVGIFGDFVPLLSLEEIPFAILATSSLPKEQYQDLFSQVQTRRMQIPGLVWHRALWVSNDGPQLIVADIWENPGAYRRFHEQVGNLLKIVDQYSGDLLLALD